MSATLIVNLKELETKVENGKGFNHKEATVLLEFVRKIISNGGTVQPQLTIPKNIADWLDKAFEEHQEHVDMVSTMLTVHIIRHASEQDKISDWFMEDKKVRLNLALAYLAGKALGVDLVKVVEG